METTRRNAERPELPQRIQFKFMELEARAKGFLQLERTWKFGLTPEQREFYGPTFEQFVRDNSHEEPHPDPNRESRLIGHRLTNSLNLWMEAFDVPLHVALLQNGRILRSLDNDGFFELKYELEQIGIPMPPDPPTVVRLLNGEREVGASMPPQFIISQERLRHRLVLVKRGDQIDLHWRSNPQLTATHPDSIRCQDAGAAPWKFLWWIAHYSKRGLFLTPDILNANCIDLNMPTAKSRLRPMISAELFSLIEAIEDPRGTYNLALDRREICLLEYFDGMLQEVCVQRPTLN